MYKCQKKKIYLFTKFLHRTGKYFVMIVLKILLGWGAKI